MPRGIKGSSKKPKRARKAASRTRVGKELKKKIVDEMFPPAGETGSPTPPNLIENSDFAKKDVASQWSGLARRTAEEEIESQLKTIRYAWDRIAHIAKAKMQETGAV